MERHLVGFCIFLITLALGVCAVNPRLMFLGPDVECTLFAHCYIDESKPE